MSLGGMIGLQALHLLSQRTAPQPRRFLSASLMVTQTSGWRTLVTFSQLIDIFYLFVTARTPRQRGIAVLQSCFSPEWLDRPSTVIHPKTNKTLTNRDVLLQQATKQYFQKQKDNFPGEPTLVGMGAQLSAVATHRITNQQLDDIIKAGTPILVVGAQLDRLVSYKHQAYLAEHIAPFEFLDVPKGSHGVKDENATEVHSAIRRLFQYAERTREFVTSKL
eukprot:c7073_g1_i1.p1 GENE.c7073_g1_i1~~c7073_g1_i1.p1  ORF type:complete len:220 (-),score=38.48 c7073_g1_i1:85-744(-)